MNFSSTAPAKPVSPEAGYIGGKRNLAGRIVPIIERTPHRAYAEPFVGMGGIFLRRRQRARCEFINDISGDVATFFRVLQEAYPYFIDVLKWRIASRAEFERLLGQDPSRLIDLHRAARFLYLQRLAFGGKVNGRTFGVDKRASARFSVSKLEPILADIHARLDGVVIEQLQRIRGRFILSLNDTPGARECFGRFIIAGVETTYTIGAGATKPAGELIVSNFDLE